MYYPTPNFDYNRHASLIYVNHIQSNKITLWLLLLFSFFLSSSLSVSFFPSFFLLYKGILFFWPLLSPAVSIAAGRSHHRGSVLRDGGQESFLWGQSPAVRLRMINGSDFGRRDCEKEQVFFLSSLSHCCSLKLCCRSIRKSSMGRSMSGSWLAGTPITGSR